MIDRRLLTNFDWKLLTLILLLAAMGVMNIYSASASYKVVGTPYAVKQIYWIAAGMMLAILSCSIDYHLLEDLAYWLYGGLLVLLVLVLVVGKTSMGATRWLNLGLFTIQPSEPMKIVIIMTFARYFARRPYPDGLGLPQLALPILILGLPALLIMKQPDLGTAIMVLLVAGTIMLAVGVRWSTFAYLLLATVPICYMG